MTYSWTPANLLLDPNVLNPTTINLNSNASFILTSIDANGCENSDEVTIFMQGGPLTVNITAVPDEICVGETSQLFANASGGTGVYTYSWISDPPGFTSDEENPFVSPLITTIYTVLVDDGINTASGSVTVTVYPLPVFDCPQYGPLCEGSGVISFSEPGTFTLNGTVVTQFDPDSAGIFTFVYSETSVNGCSDSCEFDIVVNPLPDVFAGQDQTIPIGTNTVLNEATVSGSGPFTYSWAPASKLVDPTVLNPITVNLLSSATFILTVKDASGCESSDEVTVYISGGALGINATALPDEICVGETSQLFAEASGGSGSYTFEWTSNPPGFTSDEENPFASPLITTTYIVQVDDGSNTVIDSVTVTVYPLPVFDCPQYGPVCEGSGMIVFNQPGIFKFNGTEITQFNPIAAGSYNFTYIETSSHGCADSCEFIIVVNSLPDVFAGQDQVIPYYTNTTIEDASVSGTGPFTYSWSPAGLLENPDSLHPTTVNLTASTIFTLTVVSSDGCVNVDEVYIEVQSIEPMILQAISGPGDNCSGNTVTIPLVVDNFSSVGSFQLKLKFNDDHMHCDGYTNVNPLLEENLTASVDQLESDIIITWQGQDPLTFNQEETVAELVFTLKQSGQGLLDWYTGESESYFNDPQGSAIPAIFQSGEVKIYDPPKVLLADSIFLCEGQGYSITGAAYGMNPPFQYMWTYPDGHNTVNDPYFTSVTMDDAGDYTLLATDALGCTDQKSITLLVFENPVAAFHGIDSLTVEPGYTLEAGGGLASYQWNTGDTTESVIVDMEGWYEVEMMSLAGCLGIDSIYMLFPEREIPAVQLWIPNVFSPDGDGLNDTFVAVPSNDKITSFKMLIFNRWGQFVYESDDITIGWDGIVDGKLCPGEVYVYKIIWAAAGVPGYEDERIEAGVVLLLQ